MKNRTWSHQALRRTAVTLWRTVDTALLQQHQYHCHVLQYLPKPQFYLGEASGLSFPYPFAKGRLRIHRHTSPSCDFRWRVVNYRRVTWRRHSCGSNRQAYLDSRWMGFFCIWIYVSVVSDGQSDSSSFTNWIVFWNILLEYRPTSLTKCYYPLTDTNTSRSP